jgi:hypothetical protein
MLELGSLVKAIASLESGLERVHDQVYVMVIAAGRRDMQVLLQRRLLQAPQ